MNRNYLKPFFTYYGAKWRIAPYYPSPKGKYIIEPFAGAAGYSVNYFDRRIILLDVDKSIVDLWRFLIKSSRRKILQIPDIKPDQDVRDLNLDYEEELLITRWLGRGDHHRRVKGGTWMKKFPDDGRFWGSRIRNRIAEQIEYIRHWHIELMDWKEAPIINDATYFIDAPYWRWGHRYRHNNINYKEIASYCCNIFPGQIIVCEGEGAKWLPFKPLMYSRTMRGESLEYIWTRDRFD